MALSYYLSLGSNLAPEDNLREAVRLLASYGKVAAASTVYQTPPLGAIEPQPDYLNAVVLVISDLSPLDFQKQAIGTIEAAIGRKRTGDKFAPRTIDIDILLASQRILKIEHRPVPNPEILERAFVAVPLAEIAADVVHPENGKTMAEIASGFQTDDRTMKPRPDVNLLAALDDAS